MPLILAVDTALSRCSVAVVRGDDALAHLSEPMTRGHAERLAPMAQEAMQQAGVTFAELARVAVTTGPGSFTGLRVGLAFTRGLALALAIPCLGFSTLEALALGEGCSGRRAAALPAPDGVFFALYQDGRAEIAPAFLAEAEALEALTVQPAQIFGPAAERFAKAAHASPMEAPDTVALARLALNADPAKHPPAPLYLRAPYATLPG